MRNVVGPTLLLGLTLGVGCSLIGDFGHLTVVEGGSGPGGTAASSGAGGGGTSGTAGTGGCGTTEICDNDIDDDCDEDVDCDDSDCLGLTCEQLGVTCGTATQPCGGSPLSCDNQTQDGDETDVDCGGDESGCATRCPDGDDCEQGSDCESQVCETTCQAPECGDGVVNGEEECEDGPPASFDGCSADCRNEAPHLLISEVVDDDDAKEFIEIYNPTAAPVDLTDVYLSNQPTYYDVTQGNTSDFVVRFPGPASIPAYGFVVVSLESATDFHGEYGFYPNFDFDNNDSHAPAMTGNVAVGSKIDNGHGIVVLFRWDGQSDLIDDLDYFRYGNDANDAVDKSGVPVGSSTYLADTADTNQVTATSPGKGKALYRCDTAETTETLTGGNGISGHDETSEDLGYAFRQVDTPTPGMAPVQTGPCP